MKHLTDMIAFAHVVDGGSFTVAARTLGIPKSNISRKINRLEEALGVRLLERSTRAQHLTEIGEIYYRHCKRVAEEVDHAEVSVSSMLTSPRGLIRISSSVTLAQQIIQEKIPEFLELYPEIDVDFDITNRVVDIIEEGFDVVIRPGHQVSSNLISKRLGTAKLSLYASPDYLEEHGIPKTPEDLEKHCCLHMNATVKKGAWSLESGDKEATVRFVPRLSASDFATLRHAVLASHGITLLPHYMCADLVEKNQLVNVLPEWGRPSIDVFALYPSHRGVVPKIRVFLDYFQTVFASRLA